MKTKCLNHDSQGQIALIFPPAWLPVSPYPALPVLTHYLRAQQIPVEQYDLNCEVYDHLLSRYFLAGTLESLICLSYSGQVADPGSVALLAQQIRLLQSLPEKIEQAKQILRNESAFFSPEKLSFALNVIGDAFRLVQLANTSPNVVVQPFEFRFTAEGGIHELCRARTPLDDFYLQRITDVCNSGVVLTGFSVQSLSQFHFALKGAALLKKIKPDMHVTLGGNFLSRYRQWAAEFPAILNNVDTVVLFEGRRALQHIYENLTTPEKMTDCRNVIRIQAGGAQWDSVSLKPDTEAFPLPDYEGLPLAKYLAPALIISLPIASGCHWRQCTFCSYNLQPYHHYPVEAVIDAIKKLKTRYHSSFFYFASSELTGAYLKTLLDEITASDLQIQWTSLIRADLEVDDLFFRKLKESGCVLLGLGVESASPKILESMRKGIAPAQAARILEGITRAQIGSVAYFITGFPHEESEDREATLNFIRKHKPYLFNYVFSPFVLTTNSLMFKNPAKFGLSLEAGLKQRGLEWILLNDGQFDYTCGNTTRTQPDTAESMLQKFKQKEINFFRNPFQYIPLRAPHEIFFNFLYLARGILPAGPGEWAERAKFVRAVPGLRLGELGLLRLTANQLETLPFAAEFCRPEPQVQTFLCNQRTASRVALNESLVSLIFLIDGRRSIGAVRDALLERIPGLDAAAILSGFGYLYDNFIIDLSEVA